MSSCFVKYFSCGKWQYAKLHFPLSSYKGSHCEGWACGHGKVWYNSGRRLPVGKCISVSEEEALSLETSTS